MQQTWNLKHPSRLEELNLEEFPKAYAPILRAQPMRWTLDVWSAVYKFPRGGKGMATKKSKDCIEGKSRERV